MPDPTRLWKNSDPGLLLQSHAPGPVIGTTQSERIVDIRLLSAVYKNCDASIPGTTAVVGGTAGGVVIPSPKIDEEPHPEMGGRPQAIARTGVLIISPQIQLDACSKKVSRSLGEISALITVTAATINHDSQSTGQRRFL